MPCQLIGCCQFFKNLGRFPKTAEYITNKLCLGDYESCNRFKFYKNYGGENVPSDLSPSEEEEMKEVMQCLRSKESDKS